MGSPKWCGVRNAQPDAREGQAGLLGVTERLVVPRSRVTPVEGRDSDQDLHQKLA